MKYYYINELLKKYYLKKYYLKNTTHKFSHTKEVNTTAVMHMHSSSVIRRPFVDTTAVTSPP